jgi:hypothetical protein
VTRDFDAKKDASKLRMVVLSIAPTLYSAEARSGSPQMRAFCKQEVPYIFSYLLGLQDGNARISVKIFAIESKNRHHRMYLH